LKAEAEAKAKQEINEKYIIHKVKSKETLYAISKQYDVTVEDIAKLNPEIAGKLTVGIELKVPQKAKTEIKQDIKPDTKPDVKPDTKPEIKPDTKPEIKMDVKPDDYYGIHKIHKVQSKETLYAISKQYDVTMEDVIRLNPQIDGKITAGMELRIPNKKSTDKTELAHNADVTNTDATDKNDETRIIPNAIPQTVGNERNIVFLLPFMLDNMNADGANKRFTEFYAGALLAIEEAKKQGKFSYTIYTYDTERNENKIKEILTYPELKTADLIIGPAFSNQVPYVTEFAKAHEINTLIPFSANITGLDRNPYVFQFNPSIETEVEFAAQIFTTEFNDVNIIFANIQNINTADIGNKFAFSLAQQLKKNQRPYTSLPVDVLGLDASKLDAQKKNIIIFNTDRYSTVQRYFETLNSFAQKFDISIYAQYSWQMPDSRKFKYFNITPFKPLGTNNEVRNYRFAFEQNFGWQPIPEKPSYDALGYDLTRFFLDSTRNYNNNSYPSKKEGLQSSPSFERYTSKSGFMNRKLYFNEK
ncbi:MAG: LysM peptidoglycan-binding domain-containing protein, partial [Paludibacter sp.]|jgi:LysM repeat protein|nr:LysM peptidoglycan-binding domain-containing protein [Paludibacter sp.]